MPSGTASFYKSYDISNLEQLKAGEFYSVHGGFDTTNVNNDPEVLLPLSAAKAAQREGKFGSLYPKYFVTTGNLTIVKSARKIGQDLAAELVEKRIDGVIFVAT